MGEVNQSVSEILKNVYKKALDFFEDKKYDKINKGICYLIIDYCKENKIEARETINFLYKNKPSLVKYPSIFLSHYFYKKNKLGYWWMLPSTRYEDKKIAESRMNYLYQLKTKIKL